MLCLKVATDPSWGAAALARLEDVLVDHAHCEMKAASNALALAARHPFHLGLVRALSSLAREEIDHFERVLALLARRGLALGTPPVDVYAARLRTATNEVPRPNALPVLVDRLLVAALIEARSCERFKILIDGLERAGGAPDVLELYRELFPAEARHYRLFVDLAIEVAGDEEAVRRRLEALAEREANVVADLAREAPMATIHG
jgi:tRNA-(ms[2]io[6]A)-hydroxylase